MRNPLRAVAVLLVLSCPAGAAETGDAGRGEALFGQCGKCHQIGKDAANRVGPHLNLLFGRRAGSLDDYRYSKGLVRRGRDGMRWTFENLDAYIENPKALVSDTRMNFAGISDAADRADLLAYLRRFSDNPQNIPEAPRTATATDHAVDPAILAIQGDPAYGEYLSGECVTCHQRDGDDAGIPSITNWPTDDFVVALHAYKEGLRPHPVMEMVARRLSNEEIAALAAYFETIE